MSDTRPGGSARVPLGSVSTPMQPVGPWFTLLWIRAATGSANALQARFAALNDHPTISGVDRLLCGAPISARDLARQRTSTATLRPKRRWASVSRTLAPLRKLQE